MHEFLFRFFYALFLGRPPKAPAPEKEYMWVCPDCRGGDLFHVTSNTYSILEKAKQIHREANHGRS